MLYDMIWDIIIGVGWLGSQQIIDCALLRYLVVIDVPALYTALFFIRLPSIAVFFFVLIEKIITLKVPTLNSPYNIGQIFNFSLSVIFSCSVLEFITLALSLHAINYYNIVHFLALYHIFIAFFRSWINNVTPNTILTAFALMALVYLLEDWLKIIPGDTFQNTSIGVNHTFDWLPLLYVILAAASKTLGIWIFKVFQMKKQLQRKAFCDRISWANYIADEPEKISQSLCVINTLFSNYVEAQLRIHCDQHSKDLEALNYEGKRQLIDEYFQNELSYTFQYMEKYKIFNFNKEAIDDPDLYQQEDTVLRRLIREKVYMIQLNNQQYKDLFANEKYSNLNFEIVYDDYGLHEYIWDADTPYLILMQNFFVGLLCFVATFFNYEYDKLFQNGFNLNGNIQENNFYIWITIFLGIIRVWKAWSYDIVFKIQVQTYFFFEIFAELVFLYLSLIWIESVIELQILGLIISLCIKSMLYRSAEKVKEQKEKLFHLSFVTFLIRIQKFTAKEGSQIIQMMTLCAEKLNLHEFMKILTQILCTHGIVSTDQLRHTKFSHQGKSPFFYHQIPFIFQSQLRYENNIEGNPALDLENDKETQKEDKFERYIIKSEFQQIKSAIQQQLHETIKIGGKQQVVPGANQIESRIIEHHNDHDDHNDHNGHIDHDDNH